MKAIIIQNISNSYKVVDENGEVHICTARGKFKKNEIIPIVGDRVEIENNTVVTIDHRVNYIKRPRISNVTQIVFVVSTKNPKPDLLLLDKQLSFAENLGVKVVIVFNKCDLQDSKELENIYENIRIQSNSYGSKKWCRYRYSKEIFKG